MGSLFNTGFKFLFFFNEISLVVQLRTKEFIRLTLLKVGLGIFLKDLRVCKIIRLILHF